MRIRRTASTMKRPKQFRTPIIVGATAIGIIAIATWLPFKAARQRQLDMDLLNALKSGKGAEVKSLLKDGADPNARDLSDATTGTPTATTIHSRRLMS